VNSRESAFCLTMCQVFSLSDQNLFGFRKKLPGIANARSFLLARRYWGIRNSAEKVSVVCPVSEVDSPRSGLIYETRTDFFFNASSALARGKLPDEPGYRVDNDVLGDVHRPYREATAEWWCVMSWTISQIAVFLVGLLHLCFMLGELFPWHRPMIMEVVLKKRQPMSFGQKETFLVASIVHNAAIYNGILASGLFATLGRGADSFVIQLTLLAGAVVAGLFGCATLARGTITQAILSGIALVIVFWSRA
jgi:uncharacterized membrane protein